MEYTAGYASPIGRLVLRSDGTSLTGLIFTEEAGHRDSLPLFSPVIQWLDTFFAGQNPGPLPMPLKPAGTDFQKQVWSLLAEIPYGCTTTYGALAARIAAASGKPKMSPQAVGNAVGKNPIAILIPCHRVVGAKGQLTGYAWGLSRKEYLLTLEKTHAGA